MVLTIGFLLLTSMILTTALTAAIEMGKVWFTIAPWVLRAADLGAGLSVITVLFALLFKVMPDVKVSWREAWVGAFVTAVLFSVGRFLIALYLGHSTIATNYGAAGSLVALLIWIYYSCAIVFYGAEYMKARRVAIGGTIVPKPTAALVRKEIVEEKRRKRRATKAVLRGP
jgi:membrane protein